MCKPILCYLVIPPFAVIRSLTFDYFKQKSRLKTSEKVIDNYYKR